MVQRPSISQLRAIRGPSIWLLIALFLFITYLQYAKLFGHPIFLANLTANLGLTRYTVERVLFLLPMIWAGFLFGWKGGIVTSLAALVSMLPRALFFSPSPEDALVETSAVFVVGNLISYSLELLRRERQRRAQLEATQDELQTHLRAIEANERQLAALNQTSRIIAQSLELAEVLESAVDCVIDVTGVEAVLIYTLDEEAGELVLAAHRGLSKRFVTEVSRLALGEGFNGKVAETGEPLFVEDASEDPRLTKTIVREENIHSQLIVPLRSKGKVLGTLCTAVHRYRSFPTEEVNLFTAIGNQIGIAVENARLYQRERQSALQLRASEQRYRELFENAQDAIWLQDLEGNIIAANRACARLTGYSLEELHNLKAVELLSKDILGSMRDIEQRLLKSNSGGTLAEFKLIKKDGSEVFVQLSSSLAFNNEQPVAVQHIARDVSVEKRMQENLHFLLQQITRAQEEERKRMARELHDDTIQALVVLSQQIYDLASSEKELSQSAILHLEDLRRQVNQIIQGLRRLSQDMRPAALNRLGLLPVLRRQASDMTEYSGVAIEVKVHGAERRLPDEVELVLFRIVQEALRNVLKHAQATSAEITVEFAQGKTIINVSDNGKGFDASQAVSDLPRYGKLGLAGMEERAKLLGGTLMVKSEPGKGTTLTAELPV